MKSSLNIEIASYQVARMTLTWPRTGKTNALFPMFEEIFQIVSQLPSDAMFVAFQSTFKYVFVLGKFYHG